MPSSVSGRLISGSWTVARAAVIASSVGEPVSVSVIVAFCSFDGGARRRPDDGVDLRVRAALPLYGGDPGRLGAAAVICPAPEAGERLISLRGCPHPPAPPSSGTRWDSVWPSACTA